jgi:hypothetical protein
MMLHAINLNCAVLGLVQFHCSLPGVAGLVILVENDTGLAESVQRGGFGICVSGVSELASSPQIHVEGQAILPLLLGYVAKGV